MYLNNSLCEVFIFKNIELFSVLNGLSYSFYNLQLFGDNLNIFFLVKMKNVL